MRNIFIAFAMISALEASDLTQGMDAIERGDFKSAVEYFERAAKEGNQMAQRNLAVMYNNGFGVKKDSEIASKWLNMADNKNNIASMY